MGHAFPEILAKRTQVKEVIRREEEAFNKTLDRGITVFDQLASVSENSDKELRERLTTRRYLFNKYRGTGLGLTNGALLSEQKLDKLVSAKPTTVEAVAEIVGKNPKLIHQLSDTLWRDLCRHIQIHLAQAPGYISSEVAIELYDTYGFPLDLSVLMARERGLDVETADFETFMEQ